MYKNEMKKKIIFFMPSFEGGGVEKNVMMVANNFALRNLDVSLITASNNIKNIFDKKVRFIGPKLNFWDNCSRLTKYLLCICLLFIEACKNNNFYVFCFQGNILCTIFCKLFNIKIIIRPNSSPTGWSGNSLKKFLFSKTLKLSNKIIVNSLEFKKELKTKFNLESQCIYNPLNKKEILKLSKKKIKIKFFNKNSINIISLGRLVDQKDHMTLLKAINLLKKKINLRLLIIGDGDQKKNLIKYIKNNGMTNIVKIKNRVKNPFPFILKSKIMILSSKFEGLPNVLLEAIALNKFVISSNCPTGPREILDNGKGGMLFKVGNHIELSKKILMYKKKIKSSMKMKKYAFQRLSKFDYKKNLNQYYNLFNSF